MDSVAKLINQGKIRSHIILSRIRKTMNSALLTKELALNKEILAQRIEAITNEMTVLRANYAKLEGHLSECQHWVDALIKKESELKAQSLQEIQDGQVNNQGTEQAPGEGLCGTEGEEVPG